MQIMVYIKISKLVCSLTNENVTKFHHRENDKFHHFINPQSLVNRMRNIT